MAAFIRCFVWHNDNKIYFMKRQLIGKHKVTYYDSINELPITRFHIYNRMLLVDSGVGSSVSDFDSHLERIMAFLADKKSDDAIQELNNLRQNVYLIQNELTPKHMAFAAIITEIDGKQCNDISDEGLKTTLQLLKDVNIGTIDNEIEEAKKKIEEGLETYFPALFCDSSQKEYYNLLIKRTKLVLKNILEGKDQSEELDRVTNELLTFSKPKSFEGEHSVELAADRQFEKICLIITEHLHCNPKQMTVMEFYSAFDYLQEKMKKSNKKSA